jgi:outer membrane protein insertion porin family
MATGYFQKAKIVTKGVEGDPDKINLLTEIEEQSTGEVNFGFGWSSYNGAFLEAGIQEKNFMGKGQTIGLTGQYSNRQSKAILSFTEPYFLDYDLSAGIDVDYSYFRYKDDYGYDMQRFGAGLRFGWRYFDNVRHFIRFSERQDNITNIVGTPPQYAQKEEGESTIRTIEQTISIADIKTDYVNLTRNGYFISLGLDYAGLGGDEHFLKPEFRAAYYKNFWENEWQLGLSFNAGYIHPIEDDYIKKAYRYNLGGDTLRGFHVAGIGARDKIYGNYSIGGYSQVYGTVQLNFPLGLPKEYKISGFVFYDYGWLGKPVDFEPAYMNYDDTIRTSAGIGIKWYTPMGEINVSWAKPITYEDYDRIEKFLLSFGAQF